MSVTLEGPVAVHVPAPDQLDPRTLGLQAEAKLVDWHIEYEYVPSFPVDDVKVASWIQVRDAEHIGEKESLEEFRTQMKEGTVFPPIMLMHPDTLIDGNHRFTSAKQLRRPSIPAFVGRFQTVDMAKAFAASMNQANGRRLTPHEAFKAAQTMFTMGLADEAIAREVGRSRETVRQMRLRTEFGERAERVNMAEVAATVKESVQSRLAGIKHEPVFAQAVKLVTETKPSMKDVKEIVQAVDEASSDSEAIEAIEQKRHELAVAGPPPQRATLPQAIRQARMYLGGLIKLADNPSGLLDLVDDETRKTSVERWTTVYDLADAVLKLYGEHPDPQGV